MGCTSRDSDRLAVSGDDGGEPGGRPKRYTRTGFWGTAAPALCVISLTARSAGDACWPPKLKAGDASPTTAAGGGRATAGTKPDRKAGVGGPLENGSSDAAWVLLAEGNPKVKPRLPRGADGVLVEIPIGNTIQLSQCAKHNSVSTRQSVPSHILAPVFPAPFSSGLNEFGPKFNDAMIDIRWSIE